MSDRWFLTPMRLPQARLQLFCLPYAGGGASAYRGWAAALGTGVEVNPVALPGRENRFGEPPGIDLPALSRAVATRADRPYAIYGHSLGARLGFEVIRSMRRAGLPLPLRFYVGGSRPPDVRDVGGLYDQISGVGDAEFLDRIVRGEALPAEVRAAPDLVELLLPVFRADFRWLDGYECAEEPPLPVPILAIVATDDPMVPVDQVRGWARHTSAGFTLRVLPGGGHLFLRERQQEVTELIRTDLDGAIRSAPSPAGYGTAASPGSDRATR